jgi:hypothetical protein
MGDDEPIWGDGYIFDCIHDDSVLYFRDNDN